MSTPEITVGVLLAASLALLSCSPSATAPKAPQPSSPSVANAPATEPQETTSEPSTCPELHLTFVVEPDYDARTTYGILHGADPAGLASRAASMGIDAELANAIHNATSYESVAAELESAVEQRHASIGRDMARARGAYEAAWTPITDTFSQRVMKAMDHCWIHPHYTVVVSALHPGLSSWDGDVVASKFDHNLATKRRIVAHELVLSQAFQLMRRSHSSEEVADWPVWAFSEITAVMVLEDPELRPFWPDFPTDNYFARSNYPQLAPLEAELRKRYGARESFDMYLEKAVPLLRQLDREQLLSPATTD